MYKIGEFSKIVSLPKRTIRFYDECGILTPGDVDEITGYRYYNDENIRQCEKIKELKILEFSLEEIGSCGAEITKELLLKKMEEMDRKIVLCKLKRKRIELMLKQKEREEINYKKGRVLNRTYERNNEKCA